MTVVIIASLIAVAVVVFILGRMDARWQAQAEAERLILTGDDVPCWKEQGLSIEEIRLRAEKNKQPCWQTHRLSNGYLRESCLDCEVFLTAPIPTGQSSKAHI